MSTTTSPSTQQMPPTPNLPTPSLFSLSHKTALLTGPTRGIGASLALALAESGASHLILIQRPGSTNFATRDSILSLPNPPKCSVVSADLSTVSGARTAWDSALKLVEAEGGKIDILVNCAGIQRRHPAHTFPYPDWTQVLETNLNVPFLLSQLAGAYWIARGERGKILNVASLLSFQGGMGVAAYAAAKGGLKTLTHALSNEWARYGISVNAIAPGYVGTDMNEALLSSPTRLSELSSRIPASRWGTPDDFKGPAVFLCSDASAYVSGEVLVVDGGWMGR